jgi:lipoprotein-anchoring transpeptidase ErfK/SrfK
MIVTDRRALLSSGGMSLAMALAGCNSTPQQAQIEPAVPQGKKAVAAKALASAENYQALYSPVAGEKFPVAAVRSGLVAPDFWRRDIDYRSAEAPGTIVIDPHRHYLYHIQANGRARRYGVGVGREGFAWKGVAAINSKQEWPDWYPPKEMIERQPELKRSVAQLQSGLGVAGGPHNPLGARAMYLWQDNKDTLFRIHGTLEPGSIGRSVSSGCIRMVNQDVIDLYASVTVGTKVIVLT